MPFLLFLTTQITYKRFLVLWAIVGMLLTSSFVKINYEAFCIGGADFLGFFALIFFFFSLLINNSNFCFKINEYYILVILYFIIALLSGIIDNSHILLRELIRIAIPIGFGLSYVYAFSKKDIKTILYAIALYGIVNVIFAFYINFQNNALFPTSAFFDDRNGFSRYMSIINVFFLIEFLQQKKTKLKFFHGLLLVVIFLGVLIQYSRSGYISYFISSTIVLFMCGSKSVKRIAYIVLSLMLVLFFHFTINRFHAEKMTVANYSDLGRIYLLKAGINMIKAHPIKGVGFRMSALLLPEYATKVIPGIKGLTSIHNWFVTVWAEMGIMGFVAFCALNYKLMHASMKNFLKSGVLEGKYSLFVFNALLIIMIDAFVLPTYDYENIYWIIIAIGIINLRDTKLPIIRRNQGLFNN
jgi:O-antigen ligase